ncbi:MAG: LOG family protein [candidate division KSB1 bacterium]|nr:LOG family protein [candidate division KSB1 bacterium]
MSDTNSIYESPGLNHVFIQKKSVEKPLKRPRLIKAYRNESFLNSSEARPIRILSEYLEVAGRLRHRGIKDTIVFYGSARFKSRLEAEEQLAAVTREMAAAGAPDAALIEKLKAAERDLKNSRYYEDARQLAFLLAKWSQELNEKHRFIVCSGGGPGIMEAANRGAAEAGSPTIGMNISLPFEQEANPYITEDLSFEFHYFFMRKFWFVYLAKGLVVFPGGFGTMDELFELLTLRQTEKVKKKMCVIIYGTEFWREVVNFPKLVEWGVISPQDLNLFYMADDPQTAFQILSSHLQKEFIDKTNSLSL